MTKLKKIINPFLLVFVLLTISSLDAKPLVFSEFNFSIEVPDDWILLNSTRPEYVLIARNNNNTKTLLIGIFKFPPNSSLDNISSEINNFKNGWKIGFVNRGLKLSNEQPTVIEDIPFISRTAIGSNISCLNYVTSAGDFCYGILGEEYGQNISQDPEILSIINSFRLLSPVQINSLPPERSKTGHTVGLKMNYFLSLFTIPAILLVGFLIFYNVLLRKKEREN